MDYDTDEDGKLIVNPQQAKIVVRLYEEFLSRKTVDNIARIFKAEKIKNWDGKYNWQSSTLVSMLRNEKYMGDSMLQKSYTQDYLTGKREKNDGQRTRYYVYDTHMGIISKEKFFKTACEIKHRKRNIINSDGNIETTEKKYNGQNLLANILVCEECGASFRRRTERGKVVYRCATSMNKGRGSCGDSPTVEETWIKEELAKRVCDGIFKEEKVRKVVDEVKVGKNIMLKIVRK